MTKFEEEFKALTSWEWINVNFAQQILTRFGNWHSDEEFQKMLELGGSYVIANKHLIDDNAKLVKEIANLKSQLEQRDILIVPSFVSEWIEHCKGMGYSLIGALTFKLSSTMHEELSVKILKWLEKEGNDETFALAFITGEYEVEKQMLFYLRNKLTGMYLYKKPLGGYGEDPTNYIKDLTNDFKFTQKEIDGMDVQSYEKKDEYKGE